MSVVEVLKLPVFATEEDAAEWFSTHDTAAYMNDLEEVTEGILARRTRRATRDGQPAGDPARSAIMGRAVAYETPNAIRRIGADAARAVVNDFLLDNAGNQFVAGQPHILVSALRSAWIVPVQLAYIHTGPLGSVGVVAIDDETGQVIAWTPVPDMKTASRQLRENHEPELITQFQTFMDAQAGKQ